jgi:hypothetical protein
MLLLWSIRDDTQINLEFHKDGKTDTLLSHSDVTVIYRQADCLVAG